MMQQIRDGLKGPVIYGMLVLIVGVPFAVSGIQGYLQNSTDPVVAKVGDIKITQTQLRNAYDQRYRQLQQLYGENFRSDLINPTTLREAVLKDMVQESLMRQYAHSNGYRAADSELRDYLTKISAFQENGQFSSKRYREVLAGVGQTPTRFETQQRDALMVEQLRETVLGTAFVTPAENELNAKLQHQERDFSYLKFDPAKYLGAVTVSDADVAKRFEEKKASFQAPERIRLSYIELSPDQIEKASAPTADVLKPIYEAQKATRFSTPESRAASHILINFGADKAAAKKKAEDILAQLKGGADFAAVAKASSDDTGSKPKGGDLGSIKRGDGAFPAKFETALFGIEKAGEITGPVETEFGWHIIRLNELKPARTQAFEEPEVQKALGDLYLQAEASKHFQEKNSKLEELAFDNPASLDPVAKALELKVESTDWFTRAGGPGILSNAAVITAAFSPEVLTNGENSKPITIEGGHVVVIRKLEYEAPRQKTLAEVDGALRESLKTEMAATKAQADADAALAALKGGQALDVVAKANGQTAQSPGSVKRDQADLSKTLLSALFKLPHPETDKASYGEATLEKGEVAVIVLNSIKYPADGKSGDDAAKQQATQRDARAGSEFSAYRAALEKRISVELKAIPKEEPLAP